MLIILMTEITVEHPFVMSMMPPSLFIDHLPVYFREAEEFGWHHPEDAVLILLGLRYGTNAKDDFTQLRLIFLKVLLVHLLNLLFFIKRLLLLRALE